MSRIDELIAEHCPNGVRHATLGEIAHYSASRVDASELGDMNFVGVDNLLPNKGGKTDATYRPNTARVSAYEIDDVLIGNIRPYLKKIWLATNSGGCSGDVLAVRRSEKHRSEICPKYLYYVLSADGFFDFNMRHAKGAKMPRGNKTAILDYRLAVPPLEVQREIVRILDQFTALEAELEAELEARRRQYEHYQDLLLGSQDLLRTTWAPMGEIGIFKRGRRFTKADVVEQGIPSIHYGEIYTRYGVAAEVTISQIRNDLVDQLVFALPGDVVIAGVGETVYDVGKAVAWLGIAPVAIHDDTFLFRSIMNPKFVSYYMQTPRFHADKSSYVARAKVKRLSSEGLAKIRIPQPPIIQQGLVVEALDKFDALVNDLSIGLPAELAARRKQYEHYRDRLLTFKELAP
jgi:type I restriction enzyme S subunit